MLGSLTRLITSILYFSFLLGLGLTACEEEPDPITHVATVSGYTQGEGTNEDEPLYTPDIKVQLIELSSSGYEFAVEGAISVDSDETGAFYLDIGSSSEINLHLPVLRGLFTDRVRRLVVDTDITAGENRYAGVIND